MANTHSISLNGTDQWLRAADSASLSLSTSFTIQGWIKRASTGSVQTLVSKWNTSGNQRSYEFRILADDTLELRLSNDGSTTTTAATTDTITDTNNFHFVGVSLDLGAGTCQFVIDGANSQTGASLSTSLYDSTARLGLGGEDQGTDSPVNPFSGLLDDWRIYTTNRSTASMAADYQQEITDMTNVPAYWKLNNALTDESGNSNTLTNLNTATFSTDIPFDQQTGSAGVTYISS